MTFRANSMTFRIDPDKWDALPSYRLKDEFEEFLNWFGFNVGGMSEKDAAAGWQLIKQLKEILENRGQNVSEYTYVESVARGDSQITLFPAE